MKVIVCGSKKWNDKDFIFRTLDYLHKQYSFECICTGLCKGADEISEQWAHERNIPVKVFSANWSKHGSSSGYYRDQEMIEISDLLIAFCDTNHSVGTETAISLMRRSKKEVIVFHKPIV